jgi:hypothetical protein
MRAQLAKYGIELGPGNKIYIPMLQRLTRPQAVELQTAINQVLDARLPDDA